MKTRPLVLGVRILATWQMIQCSIKASPYLVQMAFFFFSHFPFWLDFKKHYFICKIQSSMSDANMMLLPGRQLDS